MENTIDYRGEILAFFEQYQQRFEEGLAGKPDIKGTMDAFAECFIEASPLGVNCGKNNQDFEAVIPKGYEFYRSIGTKSMTVERIETTRLADNHYSAKVYWNSKYTKNDSEITIEFDVVYLLQKRGTALKIFAYITGDEQALLRKRGLV